MGSSVVRWAGIGVGGVCIVEAGASVSMVCAGLGDVGVKGFIRGDGFSGTEMRGKGCDRRAPSVCGPVRFTPPPAGILYREFWVYCFSVARVV